MNEIIQSYELIEEIGRGGMGVVYKAKHIYLDEYFAIKRLWGQYVVDAKIMKLFLNGGKILRKLDHKNIVGVKDIFEFKGDYFIVMEYVSGNSLYTIIRKQSGAMKRSRAVKLFKQMLEGFVYLQSQTPPILHRDIKPANILVTENDDLKITDFDIAKIYQGSNPAITTMKGTPAYMSPEQIISPSSVDIRTDVYSLGMTFYEMLTGKLPFDSSILDTPAALRDFVINDQVPPVSNFNNRISDELVKFVAKAIHKDREERFSSAAEMLSELEELEKENKLGPIETIEDTPEPKPPVPPDLPPTQIDPKPKKRKRNRLLYILIVAVILSVIAYLAIILKPVEPPKETAGKVPPEVVHPTTKMLEEMVFVEAGTFIMGCDRKKSECGNDELPSHEVTLSSFFISKFEVTQKLWQSVMGNNPSNVKGDNLPVVLISWNDAIEFCNKLSAGEGLEPAYKIDGSRVSCDIRSNGYRLPTEAEWEYVAKGGGKGNNFLFGGDNSIDAVAWYKLNSGGTIHQVGVKKANELGIYDLSGNVWEWCWDFYGSYKAASQVDPKGPNAHINRVARGGSWNRDDKFCRTTNRYGFSPDDRGKDLGFRVVKAR